MRRYKRRTYKPRFKGYVKVDDKLIKVHETKNYVRYRIRDPKKFRPKSFRTLDIGKPKKHQIVRGKLKKTGKWATQAVIVQKKYFHPATTKKIVEKAVKYQ